MAYRTWEEIMDEKQLKELAIDIAENKVFGTFNMSENDLNHINVVFMTMTFLDDEQRQRMKDAEVVHIYEYHDKAGPRSVNGMPCFMSHQEILKNDWEKVIKYVKEYQTRVKSFLNKKDDKQEVQEPTLF